MHGVLVADIFSPDIVVVVVIAILLLLAGPKLPKLARSLGSASHEFKKGVEEGKAAAEESGKGPATGSTESKAEPKSESGE